MLTGEGDGCQGWGEEWPCTKVTKFTKSGGEGSRKAAKGKVEEEQGSRSFVDQGVPKDKLGMRAQSSSGS